VSSITQTVAERNEPSESIANFRALIFGAAFVTILIATVAAQVVS